MAKREVSRFIYRTGISHDVEFNIYTTPIDGIVARHSIDLDDAEQYIVNMVQNSPEYRKIIADSFRKIADKIENLPNPNYFINGYISDYDGYEIDDEIFKVHEIDWDEAEIEMMKQKEEHDLTYDEY